ncbi:MAG: hypothetical protein JXA94_02390 [Parachlamydiales bacterium]|nr:hypothetical protein [Parachlamydiales bacterium]
MAVTLHVQTTTDLSPYTLQYLQTGEAVEAQFEKNIRDEIAQKIAFIFCSLWHQGAFDIPLWRLDKEGIEEALNTFKKGDQIVIKENIDVKELEKLDSQDEMPKRGKSQQTNSYVRYIFPNGKAYRYNYNVETPLEYVEDLKHLKQRYENLQIKKEIQPEVKEVKKGNRFFSRQCMITTAVALTSFVVGLIIFKK